MTEMKRKPILIPIDHGYGNVKTSNFIFPAGITEYKDEPAMATDTLCWAGRWYAIGDTHKEFIADKTADEDYLKLTMAAIAKELNKRGLTEAPVWLAVGLPLTWVGQQKDSFVRYLTQVRNLEFRFNGKDYAVEVVGVEMYAQGFAAVADRLKEFSGVNMLCDIGNGTMNIMYINNGRPISGQCYTEKFGTHQCMLKAREELMRSLHLKVDDSIIEQVLRTGACDVDESVVNIIRNTATDYVSGIMRSLREHEYNPLLMKLWFMGGGACLIQHFGQVDPQRVIILDDKLINYIRFWQAGGESEKTSMRVKAAHTQMTSDGLWRGGIAPYGYKLVLNGRIGKKNRQLYDLEIDEVKGPIVREVFDLIVNEGYGTLRAANHLNEKYPDPDKVWTPQTIRNMIRNPMYTGRFHMNDTLSEPIEKLRIISDETAQFAQYVLGQHIPRKYFSQRQAEDEALPEEAKTKTSVYGASLLSGILYCAHCGCKLIGTYCTKQRKNGAYHRPIYRCYNGSVKAKHCDGQTVYSAAKIEAAVLEVVHQYFRNITKTVSGVWEEQARIQLKSKIAYQLKAARAEREKLVVQEERLRQEVMRSIMGESDFDTELLKEMLEKNKADLAACEARLVELEDEKGAEESRMKYLSTQYELINDWAAEFDAADNDTKKMILARLIEKITVDKDYHLNITFYVAADSFRTQIAQEKPLIQIDEAERCIPAIAV